MDHGTKGFIYFTINEDDSNHVVTLKLVNGAEEENLKSELLIFALL